MNTVIDWENGNSYEAADPYLAWAELTQYQHFRLRSSEVRRWMVLIHLKVSGRDAPIEALIKNSGDEWLQVSPIYRRADIAAKRFAFCTARVGKEFFAAVASGSLKDLVLAYRLCLPVEYPVDPLKATGDPTDSPADGDGKTILALIDGGLALGHRAFLDANGESRIRHFWRQDDYSGSRYLNDARRTSDPLHSTDPWQPGMMGYGAELDRFALNKALAAHRLRGSLDESALYQDLGLWELDRLAHHGTHVFSLAAGPFRYPEQFCGNDQSINWEAKEEVASTCDLMAVQLAWANVLDTSGRSADANILDALMYLLARCPEKSRLIVNTSWGAHAGPHDGSSILEQAMLAWCDLRAPGQLQIVLSAGNHYQSRGHANAQIDAGGVRALPWRVPPESYTPHFLELWFEPDQMGSVEISLESPDSTQASLSVSERQPFAMGSGGATLVLVNRAYLGRGTVALLALNPTAGNGGAILAAAGLWTVRIENVGGQPLKVDAYIERNDVALGLFTGARQSHFEDELYNDQEGVDVPSKFKPPTSYSDNRSVIRRTGAFSSLATGSNSSKYSSHRQVFSVGACVALAGGQEWPAPYSPRLHDTSDRPRRPEVKQSPDCMAPGDERVELWGVRGAASRSGAVVRLGGTSVSVAQVVRTLANGGDPKPPLAPGEIVQ
ncbi:hypothetical protein [Hydrogenophaga sp. MI9]|uniref:hypothetical protein n=1 Tax=Hydrogenophaga sp. MI9 TaxID=3453719 RepID=UPI003EE8B556